MEEALKALKMNWEERWYHKAVGIPGAALLKPEGVAMVVGNDLESNNYILSEEEHEALAWCMKHFDFDEIFDLVDARSAREDFDAVSNNLPKGHFFLTVDENTLYSLNCGLYYIWLRMDDEELKEYGLTGERVVQLMCKVIL